ncbi:MAG: hypothetical protein HQK60_07130 [Deltaproteobacteria bacterium]|nr:hypothetical protein [Deltaproteobacteria bacterium]
MAPLLFDLADTVAGQELIRIGYEQGLEQGRIQAKLLGELEKARKEVMEILEDRFNRVYAIGEDIFKTGLQEGIKQGARKGLIQAELKGERQKAREDVIDILEARFGQVLPKVSDAVNELVDLSRLKTLLKQAALVKSIDEFVAVLEQTQSPN